jgi:hypothetical protein
VYRVTNSHRISLYGDINAGSIIVDHEPTIGQTLGQSDTKQKTARSAQSASTSSSESIESWDDEDEYDTPVARDKVRFGIPLYGVEGSEGGSVTGDIPRTHLEEVNVCRAIYNGKQYIGLLL